MRLNAVGLGLRRDIVLAALREVGPTCARHVAAHILEPDREHVYPYYTRDQTTSYQLALKCLRWLENQGLVVCDRSMMPYRWTVATFPIDLSEYEFAIEEPKSE